MTQQAARARSDPQVPHLRFRETTSGQGSTLKDVVIHTGLLVHSIVQENQRIPHFSCVSQEEIFVTLCSSPFKHNVLMKTKRVKFPRNFVNPPPEHRITSQFCRKKHVCQCNHCLIRKRGRFEDSDPCPFGLQIRKDRRAGRRGSSRLESRRIRADEAGRIQGGTRDPKRRKHIVTIVCCARISRAKSSPPPIIFFSILETPKIVCWTKPMSPSQP